MALAKVTSGPPMSCESCEMTGMSVLRMSRIGRIGSINVDLRCEHAAIGLLCPFDFDSRAILNVGAEAIHALRRQRARDIGAVDSPRDDPAARGMHRADQLGIDHLPVRPDVQRPGLAHAGGDISWSAIEEEAAPQLGRQVAEAANRVMIKAVHGAPGRHGRSANLLGDGLFDSHSLELDKQLGASLHHGERFREGGNERHAANGKSLQFFEGERIDPAPGEASARRGRARHRVMMHDDFPVARAVDVDLDAIGTEFERPEKRRKRVLRALARRTTVGDEQGDAGLRVGRPRLRISRHSSWERSSRSP